MNFPIEHPFIQLLFWFVNTPGIGGIIAFLLGGGSILTYAFMLRWIKRGAQVEGEREIFLYPTPALHQKGHDHL